MITIKNVRTSGGFLAEKTFASAHSQTIDGKDQLLLLLPAWIDTDMSLVQANGRSAEEWAKLAQNLILTGATTLLDSADTTLDVIKKPKNHTHALFKAANIPLHIHHICDGTHPAYFDEIGKNKAAFVAIKTSMDLLHKKMNGPYPSAADRLFQIAAQEDMIVIISLAPYADREATHTCVKEAIRLADKYKNQLCLQHIRTQEELELVREAKHSEMLVYAEVAYPHLFFTAEELAKKNYALPTFLPTQADQIALWTAIHDGTIDMLGSGSHWSFNGSVPEAAQLMLPLMLAACQEEKLSYERLVALTRINIENIFRLPSNQDVLLIDMQQTRPLVATKNSEPSLFSLWSDRSLSGWPAYVIAQGEIYQRS